MKYNYKNHEIELFQDTVPPYCREEFDNLGKIVCLSRGGGSIGDKHEFKMNMFKGWEDFKNHLIKKEKAAIILPVYMLDHSGISLSTTPFNDPWDSGQIGYIYATREDTLCTFGKWPLLSRRVLTKTLRERATEILKCEVKALDQYLNGDVWGFCITGPGEEPLDSCSGFYGKEYCKEEAQNLVDFHWGEIQKEIAIIDGTKDEDLPLLINKEWEHKYTEDYFKRRFNDGKGS